MFRAGCATLVLMWLLPSTLPARDAAPAAASMREWAKKAQGRYAYGVYIGGKKAGWRIDQLVLGQHAGKEVLKSISESYLRTKFDGEESTKEEKTVISYELEGDGAIVHAAVKKTEDGKDLSREVVRHGKGLRITTTQGGRKVVRTIAMPKDTLTLQRKLEAWLHGKLKAGEKFTNYSVSWEETDVDQKEIYAFKEKKTISLDGVKTPVCAVDVDVNGGTVKAEVLLDGRPILTEVGGLQIERLEKEAIARKLGAVVDLLAASSIFIERDLGPARKVDSLALELTGLGDFKIPTSHRQILKAGKESALLELRRDFRIEKAAPLTREEVKRYTKTSPRFLSDHEAIRNQAKQIVGAEKDPLKAARLLEAWVYKTLEKSYSDNADTALQVLDHKVGACQEHSLLFVSLARSLAIPAREVGGVAYTKAGKEPKPLFGWHAWAEVHDGHQWVSFDPTWHEVYVDGTHMKLSEGSRDMAWCNVVGKMKVKVIKVTTRK